jgi:general secretion pathway protein N
MKRHAVAMILLALVALILFMPLRLVLAVARPDRLNAREVSGTIWSGRMEDARFGSFDLGAFTVRLQPLPLLRGEARLDLLREGPQPLRATLSLRPGQFAVESVSGTLRRGQVMDWPIERLELDNATLALSASGCRAASGQIRLLIGSGATGTRMMPPLMGPIACVGEEVQIPLASATARERLTVAFSPAGDYRVDLSLPAGPDGKLFNQQMRGRF